MPVIDLTKVKTENHWTNKIKRKIKSGVDWTKRKVTDVVEYVKENPQGAATIVGIATGIIGGGTKVIKSINRHQALRQEKFHREREIYDHSSGQYLELKRKLRKEDIDRMNALKRNKGLKTSEALSQLNLLKR